MGYGPMIAFGALAAWIAIGAIPTEAVILTILWRARSWLFCPVSGAA